MRGMGNMQGMMKQMQKMQRHAMEKMAIPQKLLCPGLVELCTITKGSIC